MIHGLCCIYCVFSFTGGIFPSYTFSFLLYVVFSTWRRLSKTSFKVKQHELLVFSLSEKFFSCLLILECDNCWDYPIWFFLLWYLWVLLAIPLVAIKFLQKNQLMDLWVFLYMLLLFLLCRLQTFVFNIYHFNWYGRSWWYVQFGTLCV